MATKQPVYWNLRRLLFLLIALGAFISSLTCAATATSSIEAYSAVLSFGIMIMAIYEIIQKRMGEDDCKGAEDDESLNKKDDLDLTQCAKREGVDLDRFLANPESHTCSKILMKCLIKEYLTVLAKLQKYDPEALDDMNNIFQQQQQQQQQNKRKVSAVDNDDVVLKMHDGSNHANNHAGVAIVPRKNSLASSTGEESNIEPKSAKKEKKSKKEKRECADDLEENGSKRTGKKKEKKKDKNDE